jgi:lysophospholipase L1-like esterase
LTIDQTVMGQASNGPSITGPFGSKSFKAISFTPTQCLTNENGVDHTFASNNATFDPTAELAIFSSKVNGTQFYNSGGLIGLFFTGQALTAAQMQSLGNANTLLQKRLGRLSAQHPTLALFGDSLTGGQGPTALTSTWRRIVPLLTSKTELNFGVPSSRVSNHGDTFQAFILRYPEVIAAGPDEAQIIGGTNDLNLDPLATTTGTGATITQFQADLTTIYTAFQNAGIPVTATTIPYVLSSVGWGAAALAAYQAAIVAAVQAAPNPIRFVDLYAVFKALGTTAADALMSGIHPLNSGSILIANTLAKAYNTGFYDIDFSLSPGAISANSSVTVTTDSFGAALTVANVLPVTAGGSGTRVSVTPPAGLNAGVIVRVVVSAAGALNFILDNITGGAITPTAGLIYKTSVSCYN